MQQMDRKKYIINGVERFVIASPDDTLANVLRRMGLTGTKIGCGKGVCGACTVILNGKLVRSCTKKMKTVAEFSTILTIEGIGTPTHLHPIQKAFIKVGAVQCGFCTPGFIVSSYALLQENPSPTREEVRDWFEKNRNVCRCTGYKPIVDAVMAAAAVLRGEEPESSLEFKLEGDIYGSSMPRPTALAKVTGTTDYGDDIQLKMPGSVAHLAVVLSEVPHANIKNIDISEAEKMPGVYKVMTAKDVKGSNVLQYPTNNPRNKDKNNYQNVIVDKVIRRRGEVVALVAADTVEHARAAAKAVKQDLEILPAYMTFLEAARPDSIPLVEGVPNLHCAQPTVKGEDTAEIFENAPYVVEGSFHSQNEPHLPIEPDTLLAYWDVDGLLTIQSKAQWVSIQPLLIANAIGVAPDKIRTIMNPAGGSFGYSTEMSIPALVATALQNLDMPVQLTLTYEEFNDNSGKRGALFTNARLACDKDGRILAAEWDCGLGLGPYALFNEVDMTHIAVMMFHGYNVPNVKGLVRAANTNGAFSTAYRGMGSPQAYTVSENLMDAMARKIGMDPFEFRYKNVAVPGDLNINSVPYPEYPYKDLMDKARPIYQEYKASAEKARAEGKKCGVGIGFGGFLITLGFFDNAEVALELNEDGSVTQYNTWEDVGQGGDIGTLTHTLKALEPLGLRPDQVRMVMNDTKFCPDTGIAAGSRCHFMGGNACIDAANKLLDAMRKPDGTYRTYAEMKAENIPTKYKGRYDQMTQDKLTPLDPNTGVGTFSPTFMYGMTMSEVEVDPATGKTHILRTTTVADVGVIGNRLSVEGQAYGGFSHCVGYALSENYDPLRKSNGMVQCGIPTVKDVPDDLNVVFVENPRSKGPHGSCGAAEVFQSSGHMSIINGIADATGVRITDLPATPEKVKKAMDMLAQGKEEPQEKYFLGSDFEEEMEEIAEHPVQVGAPA